MMSERFDALVIGSGPAGEVAISRLVEQGLRVALCEREMIGGECAYWACIPSKTLLRPVEAQAAARRVAGVSEPPIDWLQVAKYRDFMIRELDDSKQESGYREQGVEVVRGEARITGPGRVQVAGKVLDTDRIVIVSGSDARIPPIAGLGQAGYWTNRDATTVKEIPASIIILGGGPVGIELGQLFARFGSRVTLVQSGERLIDREDPAVSELIADALSAEGIELRTGVQAISARREKEERVFVLDDGTEVRGQELLIAAGRSPRLETLGLENVGIKPGPKGINVDERCRAGYGVWAVGDVTGVMPFTHVGMYQARVASADIAGRPAPADYAAIPASSSPTPRSPPSVSPSNRPTPSTSTSRSVASNWPRRSRDPGPTRRTPAARSDLSPIVSARC